jgi:hypothetical protein
MIPPLFAVKDLCHLPCGQRRARMANFDGERGRENGHTESVYTVSPGNVHSQGPILVQPETVKVISIPQVGGLHHRYTRAA